MSGVHLGLERKIHAVIVRRLDLAPHDTRQGRDVVHAARDLRSVERLAAGIPLQGFFGGLVGIRPLVHRQRDAGLDTVGHVVVDFGLRAARDSGCGSLFEQADSGRQIGIDDLLVNLFVRRTGRTLRLGGRRLQIEGYAEVIGIIVVCAGIHLGQHVVAEGPQHVGLSEDVLTLGGGLQKFGRTDQVVARIDGRIVAVPRRGALQTRIVEPAFHVVGVGLPHPAASRAGQHVVLGQSVTGQVGLRKSEPDTRIVVALPAALSQSGQRTGQCGPGVLDAAVNDIGGNLIAGEGFERIFRAGERERCDDAQ